MSKVNLPGATVPLDRREGAWRPRLITGIFSVALSAVALVGAAKADPVVVTAQGALRGDAMGNAGGVFKGVPYAAAPVGSKRWSPPAAPPIWPDERLAKTFGAPCAQTDQGYNRAAAATSSEDCLYLNLWSPKVDAKAKLPVLLWIHGGGFTGGLADPFDGASLAAKGVVVVTINYRLGVFGYLAHPELSAASVSHASGNYGLQDQIAALKWVQANIEAFGGDAAKVTIMGQSAGGFSVVDLVTSPVSRGLFRGAIVQSGGPSLSPMATLDRAEATGLAFAGPSLASLRGASTAEVMKRWEDFAAGRQSVLSPIIDGVVLIEHPAATFAGGLEAKVPMMIGNNGREGLGRIAPADLPKALERAFGADAEAAAKYYQGPDDQIMGSGADQLSTDQIFRCGAVFGQVSHRQAGNPVFAYQFEEPMPGRETEGAGHSYEVRYIFGSLSPEGYLGANYGPKHQALAEVMQMYWTNFATNLNPNGPGLRPWPAFEVKDRAYARLATLFHGGAGVGRGLREAPCTLMVRNAPALRP